MLCGGVSVNDGLSIRIERKWSMPNKRTFEMHPIKQLLTEEMTGGNWVDPFANGSSLATVTNDLNPEFNTDYHMDAIEFLSMFETASVDGVLFDPPYSPRQISECYKSVGMPTSKETTQSSFWSRAKDEIARIVKPGGKVISFGWNSQGIGKNRGFEMVRILMVAHGASHNDTICVVETKKAS